jgi:hypothetical protein
MLTRMKVSGFRGFKEATDLNLNAPGVIAKGARILLENREWKYNGYIAGASASGKTNLMMAINDMSNHLASCFMNRMSQDFHSNYLNGSILITDLAEFEFHFCFDGVPVEYRYGKNQCDRTVYETLIVDSEVVISIDRRESNIASYQLCGAETLKRDFTGRDISPVRFVANNCILDDNSTNAAFFEFVGFANSIAFLGESGIPHRVVYNSIVNNEKLDGFSAFLSEFDLSLPMIESGHCDKKEIFICYERNSIEFHLAASKTMMFLMYVYYWYMKAEKGELKLICLDGVNVSIVDKLIRLMNDAGCKVIYTN